MKTRSDGQLAWSAPAVRELLRRDPVRALRHVASALVARAARERVGSVEVARIASALVDALDAGDIEALHSPASWARAYRRPLPSDGLRLLESIDAARFLERWIRDRSEMPATDVAFWASGLLLLVAPSAGFGPPATDDEPHRGDDALRRERAALDAQRPDDPAGNLDALELRIAREVAKVRRRSRYTPEHVARAVLVGWGMSRDAARRRYEKT